MAFGPGIPAENRYNNFTIITFHRFIRDKLLWKLRVFKSFLVLEFLGFEISRNLLGLGSNVNLTLATATPKMQCSQRYTQNGTKQEAHVKCALQPSVSCIPSLFVCVLKTFKTIKNYTNSFVICDSHLWQLILTRNPFFILVALGKYVVRSSIYCKRKSDAQRKEENTNSVIEIRGWTRLDS